MGRNVKPSTTEPSGSSSRNGAADTESVLPTLITLAKLVRALNSHHLSKIGLAAGQDELLDLVAANAPLSTGALADLLTVRSSTVSKMADRMVEAGYLTRTRAANDMRSQVISLTEQGRSKHCELQAARSVVETQLNRAPQKLGLTARDLGALVDHLAAQLRRVR